MSKSRNKYVENFHFFTSIKEFPLYEFLDAKGLHTDPNESYIVLLEDWLQSGYLLRTQSAEGSSEAAEEDNHAPVRPPQVAVFDSLFQGIKFSYFKRAFE